MTKFFEHTVGFGKVGGSAGSDIEGFFAAISGSGDLTYLLLPLRTS